MALKDLSMKELASLRENYEGLLSTVTLSLTVETLRRKIKEIDSEVKKKIVIDLKGEQNAA